MNESVLKFFFEERWKERHSFGSESERERVLFFTGGRERVRFFAKESERVREIKERTNAAISDFFPLALTSRKKVALSLAT